MSDPKVAVVMPTNRPERLSNWVAVWRSEIESVNARFYLISDAPKAYPSHISGISLSWGAVRPEEKDVIPTRTDCVRSLGFLRAVEEGAEIIITLDDDVMPIGPGTLKKHVQNITTPLEESAWHSTLRGVKPRGLPYGDVSVTRRVALSHGLWTNSLDVDAPTALAAPLLRLDWDADAILPRRDVIPVGKFFPMCGMNLAFHRDLLPAMYFGLQGPGHGVDRFGDIWAGLMAKLYCDANGWACVSGEPWVRHTRASDPFVNLEKEARGIRMNEGLWRFLHEHVTQDYAISGLITSLRAYPQSISGTKDADYWEALGAAWWTWLKLASRALDHGRAK